MKIKQLTTLKHKLQWLVLLTALLGVNQGAWADSKTFSANEYIYLKNIKAEGLNGSLWQISGGYTHIVLFGSDKNVKHIYPFECVPNQSANAENAIYRARIVAGGTYEYFVLLRGDKSISDATSWPTDQFWNKTGDMGFAADAKLNYITNYGVNWTIPTFGYYTKWVVKGLASWDNNYEFNNSTQSFTYSSTLTKKEFKLYDTEASSNQWKGDGQIIILGESTAITGNGGNCRLYSFAGDYTFTYNGEDASSNPKITVTTAVTASKPSSLYIKGPLRDASCWNGGFDNTAFSVSGNVFTKTITAKTGCTTVPGEFILSSSTSSEDEGMINGRYTVVPDGSNAGWEYSREGSGRWGNFKCTLTYSNDDKLKITVTWDATNNQFKMKIAPACSAPSVTTSSASNPTYVGATLSGTVTHDSNCSTSESGFKIYDDNNGSCGSTLIATVQSSDYSATSLSETFTDSEHLRPNTRYWFKTYAKNDGGTTIDTDGNAKSFTTAACPSISIKDGFQPSTATPSYCINGISTALSVTAQGGLTDYIYAWYKTGSETVLGNNQTFSPPTSSSGEATYYCKVSSAAPCTSYSYVTSNASGLITVLPNASVSSVDLGSTTLCVDGTTTATKTATLGGGTGTWSSSDTDVATVAEENETVTVTAVAGGSANIIYTITDGCNNNPVSNFETLTVNPDPTEGFEVKARLNANQNTGPWRGSEGSSNGSAASGGVFANDYRNITLTAPTGNGYSYYQWYTCNSDGSGQSVISGATISPYDYNITLPGTYYFLCKAGCSSANVTSGVVQIDVPWPDMGMSGRFYNGNWDHSSAGTGGAKFINNNNGTWTNTFNCVTTGSDQPGEFIIIQQYKRGKTCDNGWVGYEIGGCSDIGGNKVNYGNCSVTGIVNPDGNTWAKNSNFKYSSSLGLSNGTPVTIIVTMTGYDTYTVTLSKGCSSPTISPGPASSPDYTGCATGAPNLSVTATGGTAPLTYQWYQCTMSDKSDAKAVTDPLTVNTYTPDAYSAGVPYYYYCIVRSAGSCASAYNATSGLSMKVHLYETPVLTPSSITVTQYEPVKILSTNARVGWSVAKEAGSDSNDEYYLYNESPQSVMFKGDHAHSRYTITATSSTEGTTCTGTATITVNEDTESCN